VGRPQCAEPSWQALASLDRKEHIILLVPLGNRGTGERGDFGTLGCPNRQCSWKKKESVLETGGSWLVTSRVMLDYHV